MSLLDRFIRHLIEEFFTSGQHGELVVTIKNGEPVCWKFTKSYIPEKVLTKKS